MAEPRIDRRQVTSPEVEHQNDRKRVRRLAPDVILGELASEAVSSSSALSQESHQVRVKSSLKGSKKFAIIRFVCYFDKLKTLT